MPTPITFRGALTPWRGNCCTAAGHLLESALKGKAVLQNGWQGVELPDPDSRTAHGYNEGHREEGHLKSQRTSAHRAVAYSQNLRGLANGSYYVLLIQKIDENILRRHWNLSLAQDDVTDLVCGNDRGQSHTNAACRPRSLA